MPTARRSTYATHNYTQHLYSAATASSTPRSAQEQQTLPTQVQDTVPSCAQSCLERYISQEYAICSPQDDFTCLCSQYSSQGYTLGELAFICLQQDCAQASQDEQETVYSICSAQTNAVTATHSTLTLPATTTSLSGVKTTTVEVYATSTGPPPVSSSLTSSTLSTYTVSSSPTANMASVSAAPVVMPSTSTSTTIAPSSTTTQAASYHSNTSLTSAQAVGVSIAAFGGMAAIIALIFLIACIRRKKATTARDNKHDSYDFIDEEPPRFSPFHNGIAELESEKRRKSQWRTGLHSPSRNASMSEKPVHCIPELQGYYATPKSQPSNDSMRTLSQLLPEKPGSTPPPPPPPKERSPQPQIVSSPATVFEEEKTPRVPSTELAAFPRPPQPAYTLPGKNIRRPQFASQHTTSPEANRLPSLSLEIPRQASKKPQVPSPKVLPPPPIPIEESRSGDRRTSRSSRAKSGASTTAGSLLNYYASPEAGASSPDDCGPLNSPYTPISLEPQRRVKLAPSAITVSRPAYPPRAVRRSNSKGSDTSFESTDPDEPTPPEEEEKQLSPVAEHSPIAAIRYPKVPRSSNQSVPRSPPAQPSPRYLESAPASPVRRDDRSALPSHRRQASNDWRSPVTPERQLTNTSTLSGSTLATKRRIDSGPKRLVIDTSHSRVNSRSHLRSGSQGSIGKDSLPNEAKRQESPLKGYGRVASGPHQGSLRYSRSGLLSPDMRSPGMATLRSPVTQEVFLRSPLWEPKLTPSRRGDDLYLSVSVATPH